jgi:hypothetical protein
VKSILDVDFVARLERKNESILFQIRHLTKLLTGKREKWPRSRVQTRPNFIAVDLILSLLSKNQVGSASINHLILSCFGLYNQQRVVV